MYFDYYESKKFKFSCLFENLYIFLHQNTTKCLLYEFDYPQKLQAEIASRDN